MLSLQPIIDRIKSARVAGFERDWFRQVAGAAEFAKLAITTALPLPACYVVRAADPAKAVGERRDSVTVAFDVVIAVTNLRTATAGETDDALLRYRAAVYQLLRGWRINDSSTPIALEGGQVIEYTDGDLWWRDRYSLSTEINNYLPAPPAFADVQNTNVNHGANL
ncbi:hypothetical protein [Limnohabitans sp.]|uniref:phage tail terminator protein n=1 Tax=Limnohabitans sp. TaxID=1907725 RepID=UPI00286F51A9|nr:hypothetical protein [Limnohabitans sp.]